MGAPKSKPHGNWRILVVDDHPFFRDGLISWLERQADLDCCGHAERVDHALALIKEFKPHLVLLDLQLKNGDGLDLLRALPANEERPQVIVLSQKDETLFAERAIRAGARGFIMKEEATETVLTAIRTVLRGGLHVSSRIARQLVVRLGAGSARQVLEKLSHRELQVFQLLGQGKNTKAIAAEMKISVKTVDFYRESIKRKLGLADGVALIRHATLWQQERRLPET